MIPSRRNLLETLRNKQPVNSEEMLTNVRSSLGTLGKVKGNPLTASDFSINVQVFFADPTIPALIAPAAVPAAFQTTIPLYLFGLKDMYGNYQKTLPLTNANPLWTNAIQETGFAGYNLDIIPLSAPLILLLADGDYIIYMRPVAAPNLECMIRIRCQQVAYSTLVHSLMSDVIFIDVIRMFVNAASILQYTHTLTFATLSTLGRINSDTVDPRLFILPTSPQNNIADLPVKIPFDKRAVIATAIDFTCQEIDFKFFVKEIEVLTKREYK